MIGASGSRVEVVETIVEAVRSMIELVGSRVEVVETIVEAV